MSIPAVRSEGFSPSPLAVNLLTGPLTPASQAYLSAGAFLAVWLGSVTLYKAPHIDERYTPTKWPLVEAEYDPTVAIPIDLSDRRALVTGSGAGIGREIARWLARAGATVVVHDVRAEKADTVVREICDEGYAAHALIADARDDEALVAMVGGAVAVLGGLDIAVNNIGMYAGQRPGPFTSLGPAHWRALIEQNLVITALAGAAQARAMTAGGVIVNVSSGETTRPSPGLAAYGAAKAAINHLTQTMAVELGPLGIRVLAVAPGTTLTETVASAFDDEHVAALVAATPLRRMTEPDELGRLVVFLVSDLARCITGQLILADAGAFLSRTRPENPSAPSFPPRSHQ